MIKEVISYAKECQKKYDGSLKNLLFENDVDVIYDDNIAAISAYTLSIRGKNIIVVDSNLQYFEHDFVVCHEMFHILKHDTTNRCFSKIIGTDRFELEANIFSLIFLNLNNIFYGDSKICKIIRYTADIVNTTVV